MKHTLALPLFFIAAAAAGAQEAVTIKLKERGPGETAVIAKVDTRTFTFKLSDGKGKVLSDKTDVATDIKEYKETILARDGAKPPTKVEREYSKLQVKKGAALVDSPLQGKTVIIEKKAGKFTAVFKGGGEVPGPASESLLKEFSRRGESEPDFDTLILPKTPVKPGERWKLDMAAIVKDLAKTGEIEATPIGATGEGLLVKTYTKDSLKMGVMQFKLEIPVKAMGKAGNQLKFTDGAKVLLDLHLDVCIDGSAQTGHMKSRMIIRGDATLPNAPNVIATVNMVSEMDQVHRQLKAK